MHIKPTDLVNGERYLIAYLGAIEYNHHVGMGTYTGKVNDNAYSFTLDGLPSYTGDPYWFPIESIFCGCHKPKKLVKGKKYLIAYLGSNSYQHVGMGTYTGQVNNKSYSFTLDGLPSYTGEPYWFPIEGIFCGCCAGNKKVK